MSITLPLNEMTIHEKLAAMEMLWDDLARFPENVESPVWHENILNERGQRAAGNMSEFTDWEIAKTEIRIRRRDNRNSV